MGVNDEVNTSFPVRLGRGTVHKNLLECAIAPYPYNPPILRGEGGLYDWLILLP